MTKKQKRANIFNFSRTICKCINGQMKWILNNLSDIGIEDEKTKEHVRKLRKNAFEFEEYLKTYYQTLKKEDDK